MGAAGVTAGGAALLVACGNDSDSGSTSTTTPNATDEPTPTTQAPAAGITGEVLIWHPYSQPERQAALQQAYDAFTEANPGASVTSEVVAWGDYAGRWAAGKAAGELPDIAVNIPENILAAHTAEAVDTEANQAIIDAVGGESFFADGYFDRNGRINGQVFNLPHYAHNRLNIYRQDRLDAAGLGVPRTMQEVLAAAEAMNNQPEYRRIRPASGTG